MQVLHVQEVYPSGQNGVSLQSGQFNRRELNLVVTNTIPGAMLLPDFSIFLPNGEYDISAWCQGARVSLHQARLFDVPAQDIVALGLSEFSDNNSASPVTTAKARGLVVLEGDTNIELQHYVQNGHAFAGGFTVNSGEQEVYSDVFVRKEA